MSQKTWDRGFGWIAAAAILGAGLILATAALASKPQAVLLPATGDGVGAGTLEVVDSTLMQKIPDLGYTPLSSSSSSCNPPSCSNAAQSIGKAKGAAKVVAVHVQRSGDQVAVRLFVHDVAGGGIKQAKALTTTSGVLAQSVKLLKANLEKPSAPAPVAPEPKPKPKPVAKPAPEPSPRPVPVEPEPAPVFDEPEETSGITDRQIELVHGVWKDLYNDSTAYLAAGTVTTLVGVGLTITSVVLWKDFADWKDKIERDRCIDCIDKGPDKLKVNAVFTGLAIATVLPGMFVLVTGIVKRSKAMKLRSEMARLIPDMNLALAPDMTAGELSLTWRF